MDENISFLLERSDTLKKDELSEPLKKELAVRLGRRRIEMGLTQEQAAERCGVTTRDYQAWEQKSSLPGLSNALRIRVAMGLSLDDLADTMLASKETALV